jgi:ComF family protein
MVNNWMKFVQLLVFPPVCAVCGRTSIPGGIRDLCPECDADLPRIPAACLLCGLPLPERGTPNTPCGRCQAAAPVFDRCFAPFEYVAPVSHLITGLKYGHRLAYARLLGELLAEHVAARQTPLPERLLPVPLHPTRLRQRGFNQALELGRVVARRLAIAVDSASLHRVRATASQADLDRRARRRNVRHAFTVRRPIAARHVAILDDVVTTGSTVSEIARILKAAGVEEISVWAVARTPG